MDLTSLVPSQYLPYAKATIVSRAIPSLDGMKPVNRRILYVMYNDGLWKPDADQVKSATIVGKVMKYHPNGDSSIYGALVTQASGREGMNIPFVQQDMRSLNLHKPVDAVLATCDGVNYLMTDEDLQ